MDQQIQKNLPVVVGVSAVSGGGKTRVANELVRLLPNTCAVYFDEFDDTTEHPPDLLAWMNEGGDYNAWKAPVLAEHLLKLRSGDVTDPDRSQPVKYIIFDAPLGRAHEATGKHIDHMVFLDTPLDVAMARRIVRDGWSDSTERQLHGYLDWTRKLYEWHIKQVSATSDLILDGTLHPEILAERVINKFQLLSSA